MKFKIGKSSFTFFFQTLKINNARHLSHKGMLIRWEAGAMKLSTDFGSLGVFRFRIRAP